MKFFSLSKYILISLFSVTLLGLASGESYAQNTNNPTYEDIKYSVHVIDATSLISGKIKIYLWGVEKIKTDATIFNLKIIKELESKIAGQKITCTIKERDATGIEIRAQCINSNEEDLSLFLLQKGYVTADRSIIYGSIYEKPYLHAETQAQLYSEGVWSDSRVTTLSSGELQNSNFMLIAFFIMGVFIVALGVLSFYIMRSFGKVVDIQNHSIDLAAKERTLKDKEKFIIASMIYAEVNANKSKTDAYLMVYKEMLRVLNDPNRTPKYQKTGDIVQKQPNLDRAVFDGNTSKLDLFGSRVASEIIHYYARIKTSPDYIEVKTDEPKKEVVTIIEAVIDNAEKVDNMSDRLIKTFMQNLLIEVTE